LASGSRPGAGADRTTSVLEALAVLPRPDETQENIIDIMWGNPSQPPDPDHHAPVLFVVQVPEFPPGCDCSAT